MDGVVMMGRSILASISTSGFTMMSISLPRVSGILTVSSLSGVLQREKFNGVPDHIFYLHLKETEFRFNHRRDNLYHKILKLLRLNLPLFPNKKARPNLLIPFCYLPRQQGVVHAYHHPLIFCLSAPSNSH
jgi:hypothetical protein